MKFGVIGLGRMGASLSRHAIARGHSVVGVTRDPTPDLTSAGLEVVNTVEGLAAALNAPRLVFVYVPHGEATDEVCTALRESLSAGDVVVDGGNSHWDDSIRRARAFAEAGVRFLDMGTSGGVPGAQQGACFMVGGDLEAYQAVEPILLDLAIDREAVIHAGPAGAGHFAKLVHNAIEFGMVQAIAEGVELLKRSDYEFDLPALFTNWNHGSVIRSWLVELMGQALQSHPNFELLSPYVEDTGEVKWVVRWALDRDVPTPVIAASQTELMRDRDLASPSAKAVALLRNAYGGHPVHLAGEDPR